MIHSFENLPGTSYDLLKLATSLADRVSVNTEAATSVRFKELSAPKTFNSDILR